LTDREGKANYPHLVSRAGNRHIGVADRGFERRQDRLERLEDTTLNLSISTLLVIIIFLSFIEDVTCDTRDPIGHSVAASDRCSM
jgi:hypothetical protein